METIEVAIPIISLTPNVSLKYNPPIVTNSKEVDTE